MLKVFGYKTLFGLLVRSTSKFSRLATVIAVRTVTFYQTSIIYLVRCVSFPRWRYTCWFNLFRLLLIPLALIEDRKLSRFMATHGN